MIRPNMKIGGYVPCSLSDYPGRLAAVVFTQGCNWRCPWCHNPALVYPERFTAPLAEETVFARLAARRAKLDGVVVTGGEPTLQPDLAAFLGRVKALGFLVKLDTNGSRPRIVRELLSAGLLDFVAMDVKAPWPRYAEAAGAAVEAETLAETIALVRGSGVEHQLRTTRWPGLGAEDEPAIREIVRGSPHTWQEWRPV
jgi:pyruvate formate lyase activating enzyme